jgi:hypothetical protein
MSLYKRLVLILFTLISTNAKPNDWFTIDADDGTVILAKILPADSNVSVNTRLKFKIIHKNSRDMMGLTYNGTIYEYLVSCKSTEIYQRQQFLLNDEQIVWTFPESKKTSKQSLEIPEYIIREACDRLKSR